MSDGSVLTTGQVARICRVAPRTVSKWFDHGQLAGYRIPGSRDRRIPVRTLLEFLRQHGMPTDEIEPRSDSVLLVCADDAVAGKFTAELTSGRTMHRARTAVEAGVLIARLLPDTIFVDPREFDAAALETSAKVCGVSPRIVLIDAATGPPLAAAASAAPSIP